MTKKDINNSSTVYNLSLVLFIPMTGEDRFTIVLINFIRVYICLYSYLSKLVLTPIPMSISRYIDMGVHYYSL